MLIEGKSVGEVMVVKPLDPRIDASSALDFKGKMVDWINQGHHCFILDLSSVDFIDSSGLSAIVSVLKTLGGGKLCISGLKDTVKSLFRLTRMDRVFQIYPSTEEALAALSETVHE